jgi:hypothetical protein
MERVRDEMRVETIARVAAFALVVAGTSMLAAPQQTTRTPGQMTEAHVWVQNHGRGEAVPVELRDVNLVDGPLKVQIINGEPAFAAIGPLPVREVRRLWEYESIIVPPQTSVSVLLNQRGAAGWETTGIWTVGTDGATTLLLKRPR